MLLGTAVQQDGPSASLTAPNGSSQKRLLQTVQHALDEDPRGLHLEAHGTGTALGDPIEVGAAVGALCRSSKAANVQREVQCSSLKANMGHMEACAAAAGLASLL
ncbi:beta-ketoacyl synthase, partial [Pelagophyceae sp. CCMP2097]